MSLVVGIDVAKEFHWVEIKVRETGEVLASRKVGNTPPEIEALILQIRAAEQVHGPAQIGIDLLGGIAGLLQAMCHAAELPLLHIPGLAVNRARRASRGGEHKSDPRDARVIADQMRLRDDLRIIEPDTDLDVQIRLLASHRHNLVVDQTRRIARLRDLLCSIHPGLERVVDPTLKTDLALLTRYVTPDEIRRAGRRRITEYMHRAGGLPAKGIQTLVDNAVDAATRQRVAIPGDHLAADLIRELARDILATRARLAEVDASIAEALTRHPDAALIRSLPGMGATLTAEFLALAGGITRFATGDQLASAAGLAPILKQSGKSSYQQRATGGDKALKRIFYQSAFCALQRDPASRAFYDRKRSEGKRHHQCLVALARRRINVLHAILRTRQPYAIDHARTT